MKAIFLFLFIIFFSCQSGQKNKTNNTTLYDTQETGTSETTGQDTSNTEDLSELPLGLQTLRDFERNGKTRSAAINDSLFIGFLNAFTNYQNEANEMLYKDPDYRKYNTLAYISEDGIAPEAIRFRDSVKQIGFVIATAEGAIYLDKDPDFLLNFSPYLSERMNVFLNQYNKEIKNPFAEDAALLLSTEEHINRILFWEHFAAKNPDFELPDYATNQFKTYLYFFMMGMDNTPVYEAGRNAKIRTDLVDAYKSVIQQYPDSKAAGYLKDYLDYLESKNFTWDNTFREYGSEKFPGM